MPHGIMFHHFHHEGDKPYAKGSITSSEFQQIMLSLQFPRDLDRIEFRVGIKQDARVLMICGSLNFCNA